MIVKWQDESGTSFYDYVIKVTKLHNKDVLMLTQATLDEKLVSYEFSHGYFEIISNKGVVVGQYDLGPLSSVMASGDLS